MTRRALRMWGIASALVASVCIPTCASASPVPSAAHLIASNTLVKPSPVVKRAIVAQAEANVGGAYPRNYGVRLARSDHRYAVMWLKKANSGYGFVHRETRGRWSVLDSVSWRTDPDGLCTVAKLRRASVPERVRQDFVAAGVCYR